MRGRYRAWINGRHLGTAGVVVVSALSPVHCREEGLAAFERALQWYECLSPGEFQGDDGRRSNWLAVVLYNAERPQEAIAILEAQLEGSQEDVWKHANIGVAAALAGDTARAEEALEWLDGYTPEYGEGLREWQQARISARLGLGRGEEAIWLLSERGRKRGPGLGTWSHVAIDLEPLSAYAPFEEFLRPKG